MDVAQFSTAQPWGTQVFRSVLSSVIFSLLLASFSALCLGRIHAWAEGGWARARSVSPALGYGIGAWIAALGAVGAWFGKGAHPVWMGASAAGASIPWAEAVQMVCSWVGVAAFLMLLLPWVEDQFKRPAGRAMIFGALGLAVSAFIAEDSWLEWLGVGFAMTAALLVMRELITRTSVIVLIPLMASLAMMRGVRSVVLNAFPGAIPYGIVLVLGVAGVSWVWVNELRRERLG